MRGQGGPGGAGGRWTGRLPGEVLRGPRAANAIAIFAAAAAAAAAAAIAAAGGAEAVAEVPRHGARGKVTEHGSSQGRGIL